MTNVMKIYMDMVRAGGMPQMIFEYVLKLHNIDPATDLTIIQNIDFGLTAEAFASGTADYTVEFEPFATSLEQNGDGYVVASLGEESGYVPYTCFSALASYMKENPEIIQGFTNAIQKSLDYVANHTPAEIADIIQPQFAETDTDTLITIIDRYAAQDTWKTDCIFTEDAFTLLQNILDQAGELTERVGYETLIDPTFAQNARN
jgi:NitT/TauT family transport system substrate-binding protein